MMDNDKSAAPNAGFVTRWVYGQADLTLRRQLVDFWLREGAIQNADEAWRRAWEVASVMQHGGGGEMAGVCTVAIRLDDLGRAFGYVRIFIRPGDRRIGLNRLLMLRMIEGFEAFAGEPGAPRRLLANIENPKITRRGSLRVLSGLGFAPIGVAPNGEMIIERVLGK